MAGLSAGQTFQGFSPDSSAKQAEIESKFKAIPTPDEARRQHRIFTAEPHPAGSERNNELARYIAEEWKKQGLEDIVLRRYDVFSSDPKETMLEMVAPVHYKASLREAAYDEDPDTKNPNVSSAWMGMSKSGDITAPVIYAHSGNPEDFALLKKNGIDVKGKIVIVRYSNPYSYRGFKALTAEKEGAAAILIYSDPAEDGYKKGKVFPEGPWGPETHLQRGAIEYDFQQAGDPTTPGWPSLPGAKHIPVEQASPVPKIMALPLSWHDAKPLLENMDGPVAPNDWQGGLPIKYRLGGDRVRVHLKIQMEETIKPNYVVEGRIRGSEYPDQWVLAGNHRDAWVFGGVDPSSGTASMMELTRGLGSLAKQGIRPKRTMVFLSWDGEETSYAGSAEWSEQFAHELRQKAVAYLNVDSSTSGPNFQGSSVGSLAPLLVDASKAVQDPSGKPLYAAWQISRAEDLQERNDSDPLTDFNLTETRIGSGSDYAALLDHVGVPVMDLSFDGPYGVYHSVYDDFYWMNHFGDPGYHYHTLMAQLWGVLALRLANADFLPYDFGSYGGHIRKYLDTLGKKNDLSKLNLRSLRTSVDQFQQAGEKLNGTIAAALSSGKIDPQLADQINRGMMAIERNWLTPEGIPGRPWYKHVVYACRYTYAHLELPGLTEAVEKQDLATAQQQAAILESALRKNAELVNQLNEQLACAGGITKQGVALCLAP
ncbi:MAG: M28 family metallopeptidase [Acidobacteria bacterium]|nr:M28 family metallopeptidase [Acidobacteriota bacterium]